MSLSRIMTETAPQSTHFYVAGISHHTAPLALRERLAITPDQFEAAARRLQSIPGVSEYLILNTCNRVELYLSGDMPNPQDACLAFFENSDEVTRQEVEKYQYFREGNHAVTHLFQTAAGLDSQMLGETEILGQVKDAYTQAHKAGTLGSVLNRVFQKSFQAAKWVRTHTGIGRGQTSIGNVATELAIRICGELADSRILLVGTGEAGERTAQSLQSRGARSVNVSGRNQQRARELAGRFHGAALEFPTFTQTLHEFDIVIGSTAANAPVIEAEAIAEGMKQRPTEPLFLIDLAVPRDIDPKASKLRNVYLYNLDDLAGIANENLKAREAEVAKAKDEIQRRACATWESLCKGRNMHPHKTDDSSSLADVSKQQSRPPASQANQASRA